MPIRKSLSLILSGLLLASAAAQAKSPEFTRGPAPSVAICAGWG